MSEQKTKKKAKVVIINDTEQTLPQKAQANDPMVVQKRKILFVASEARPFVATGGLADVIGSLPQALAEDPRYDIRVVLPMYSEIRTEMRRKMSFLGNIYVALGWRNQYCGIFKYENQGITFYFIDTEYYF